MMIVSVDPRASYYARVEQKEHSVKVSIWRRSSSSGRQVGEQVQVMNFDQPFDRGTEGVWAMLLEMNELNAPLASSI